VEAESNQRMPGHLQVGMVSRRDARRLLAFPSGLTEGKLMERHMDETGEPRTFETTEEGAPSDDGTDDPDEVETTDPAAVEAEKQERDRHGDPED
jgi:hypothetical protein